MNTFFEIPAGLYITHLKTAIEGDFQARSGLVLVCFSYVSRSSCAPISLQMASFLVYSSFRNFLDRKFESGVKEVTK